MTCDQRFLIWRDHPAMDAELKAELIACQDKPAEIEDRFYRGLEFGTGGLRGVIGAGSNRMNVHTVAKATRGLAAYLKATFDQPSCAIAYDSRNKSDAFARVAAATLAEAGVQTHLFDELMPTPVLSFATRRLACEAGIVITASHNPAQYNGYKVYGPDGCQITLKAAEAILGFIEKEAELLDALPSFDTQLAAGRVQYIGGETLEAYYAAVLDSKLTSECAPLLVVYSPLNGAGNKPVRHVLSCLPGIRIEVVPEQELPDGNFPTCPYPNPEIREAMALSAALAAKTRADICLATDPDCDRVGVGIPVEGDVRLLNGNEMGAMLLDFVCKRRVASGDMPMDPVAIKTIVTTEMATAIAARYGVELRNVLTGFKFIGEQIGMLEAEGRAERFIFGFEESCGYLSGSFVRDKDAVNGALLICQMAAHYKAQGLDLLQVLDSLYEEYGYFKSDLLTFTFDGPSGIDTMNRLMDSLRRGTLPFFGGGTVERRVDYQWDDTGLPRSNVIALTLSGQGHVVVRPSGTEPKLKVYLTAQGQSDAMGNERLAMLRQGCEDWVRSMTDY